MKYILFLQLEFPVELDLLILSLDHLWQVIRMKWAFLPAQAPPEFCFSFGIFPRLNPRCSYIWFQTSVLDMGVPEAIKLTFLGLT